MSRVTDSTELIPSPRRLIMSLRDMGYDFAQAVADIVDNSIEAKATIISIDVEFEGNDSWVRIADNGKGMNPEQLREAMRYGAEREYQGDDLGKFGLGLKTASLSQCQRLSVASRCNRNRADIAAYSWDIRHIEHSNRWEILSLRGKELTPALREPLSRCPGTVVIWERLDRILGYEYPYGEAARKRLSQMCREIEMHLGMVFHRFLSGELKSKRLKILLNGNPVSAWDPFCSSEKKTKVLSPIRMKVEHEGVVGEILIQPYILPHQDDFSSPDAFRHASGPASWNQQQGFYIYRANRLIQSGGWSGLRAPDEHTKLARVAAMFSPRLDEAFKINVAKMRVQMPTSVRDAVRDATAPVVKLAREIYDRGSRAPRKGSPSAPPRSGADRSNLSESRSGTKLLSAKDWARLTLRVATKGEKPIIQRVIKRLLKT